MGSHDDFHSPSVYTHCGVKRTATLFGFRVRSIGAVPELRKSVSEDRQAGEEAAGKKIAKQLKMQFQGALPQQRWV